MNTIDSPQKDPCLFPRFRENVWHIDPSEEAALLITTQGTYEVPTAEVQQFLRMRSYCTGHNSLEDIARLSEIPLDDVKRTINSLAEIDLLCPSSMPEQLPIAKAREILTRACDIWSDELRHSYIGNQFARGNAPKSALIGWLLEMYHYIRDFPLAIAHGAKHAKGKLQDVLNKYANEEKHHDEFIIQTLLNLGLSRIEIETSTPMLSTRMIGFLMRELFELEPSTTLMVAALVEAQEFDEEGIAAFLLRLKDHYGVSPSAFDPYFKHQQIDVGLGHAQLMATHIELVQIEDVKKLDVIVNKIHDLKHAFDLQGLEIREYYSNLNGKYVPRQPIETVSLT